LFFDHVKNLNFDDRPDYDYLKRLFRELFFRKGFSYDNMFDWELKELSKNLNVSQETAESRRSTNAVDDDEISSHGTE
jgi:hypothetical protein